MLKPLALTYSSVAFTVLALTWGFMLAGFPLAILSALVVGLLWYLSIRKDWRAGETISLIFMMLVISFAGLINAERILLLLSALGALAAWDLGNFYRQLAKYEKINNEAELTRAHLLRLSAVLIIGLTLPLIAFSLQFNLQFWQVFLLGLVLLFGLGQIFSQLKRTAN